MTSPSNPFKNAEICTHCGYCLPGCPTYKHDNDETESPRGRVAIVLALAAGTITHEEAAPALSRCLLCRACHTLCPAAVRPAKLVLLARNITPQKPKWISRILHFITASHSRTALVSTGLIWYQASGLQRHIKRLGLLNLIPPMARLEALLPNARPNEPIPTYPAPLTQSNSLRVGLLCGCMARLFYPRIGPSVANLLAIYGVDLTLLPNFGCCGAPYRESGNRKQFLRQARRTLDGFIKAGAVDVVICDSSICAVTVKSYGRSLADDPRYAEPAKLFTEKVMDFNVFLLQQMEKQKIAFGDPNLGKVAYHDHCQTRFGLGIINEPRKIVDALPVERGEIVTPDSIGACCGAGGEYMLHHPKRSQAIRTEKLAAIAATKAECVVANNPGCMLHLEAGLKESGSTTQVRHLAELLWSAYLNHSDQTRGKK